MAEDQGWKWIKISDEMVRILSDDWSEPVQVRIDSVVDNVLELVIRSVGGIQPRGIFPKESR